MDLIRNFNNKRYIALTSRFPEWKLSFKETFDLLFDLKSKLIIKTNPKLLLNHNKIKYDKFIIPGNLLYKVIEWYRVESSRF